jgi:predicted amidohydrolase
MNVSIVQLEPKRFDKTYNLDKLEHFIHKIVSEQKQSDLIIFPELMTTGYECGDGFYRLAETFPDGPSIKLAAGIARKYNTGIIFGFAEEDPAMKGVLYNSAALIDKRGNPIGTYRKVHLFGEEKLIFRPGWEYPVFKLDIGTVGIMICWDTLFPEAARIYALKGADLLAICTNWEKPYAKEWDFMTSARAFDNTVYVAAANRIGTDDRLSFFGHSRILDPLGNPIVELNEEIESYASAALDTGAIKELRTTYWTQLRDRRPDTYQILTQK